MERIGLVSTDLRLGNELGKWIQELPGEFELVDLTASSTGPPATGDPDAASASAVELETNVVETEAIKPKFVIYDASFKHSLSKIREELELKDVPWLAIGLEEHARNPHAPQVNGADDLILVPLDKSVFLQKVEFILAGDASVTPSYLFLAKADLPIELAKAVHITHISETACTILSPRPVARGVEGTLVSKIFGTGVNERVEVRATESVAVFDSSIAVDGVSREPSFEVKLRFFGFRHAQLNELRRWIALHSPRSLTEITRSNSKPKSIAHIALITPQSTLVEQLKSTLENLAEVEVQRFQGFTRFRAALEAQKPASSGSTNDDGPLSALVWSTDFIGPKSREKMIPLLPNPESTIFVRLHTETTPSHVEKISPLLHVGQTLIGARFETWANDLSPLTNAILESDRDAFQEAIEWALANSSAAQHPEIEIETLLIVGLTHRIHAVLKISLQEIATPAKSALLKITILETVEKTADRHPPATPSVQAFEAIMVDASLLSFDAKARVQTIADWMEKYDVRNAFGTRPPLIVFNAKEEKIASSDFRGTSVRQLIYDFTDRRYQAELFVSLSRSELWTSPQLSVAALKTDLKAYLGRPAHASGISEVSLVITDRVPMKKGSELLVLSPLWSQAPEGLWARLRSASLKGEGQFNNEFVFFGASDLVQKEIRKFAREDYIKKKAQGQG